MDTVITDEMKAEFRCNEGNFCPLCDDGDLEYEAKKWDDSGAIQICHCSNCNHSFKIYYDLVIADVELKK